MGTFTPHVVLRNLLSTAQSATITVEYPQPAPVAATSSSPQTAGGDTGATAVSDADAAIAAPALHNPNRRLIPAPPLPGDKDHHPEWGAGTGATVGVMTLAPLPVGPYRTVDYSLAAAMSQLPLPLPFCSIRIQFSGPPGSLEAEVSSVEDATSMVVDARVENEGNGWAGSGANPWHLDTNTESILFLTNEGDKTARIGFAIMASGTPYYLAQLELQPHETRLIDIRELRDTQLADAMRNNIPAAAADGSVSWVRIDNVPVMGRLMVFQRHGGTASSYDCCTCPCPITYEAGTVVVQPGSFSLIPNTNASCTSYCYYENCNGYQFYASLTDYATWSSDNTSVAVMDGSVAGQVDALAGGTADITASYSDCAAYQQNYDGTCSCEYDDLGSGTSTANVQVPTRFPDWCSITQRALRTESGRWRL